MSPTSDIRVLRELARSYAEIAADPVQEERRELWRRHLSLERTRVPIVHINLKDVYTLEGNTTRLKRWMDVARAVAARTVCHSP